MLVHRGAWNKNPANAAAVDSKQQATSPRADKRSKSALHAPSPFRAALLGTFFLFAILALCFWPQTKHVVNDGSRGSSATTPSNIAESAKKAHHAPILSNCTTTNFVSPFVTKQGNTNPPKPMWMPSYPNSGSASATKQGDVWTVLLNGILGMDKVGVKNYHMSMRNRLKRCIATASWTAACTQHHPLVSIDGPVKQKDQFDDRVLLVVRNFATAFPAFLMDKAQAYHKQNGQMRLKDWTSQRDSFLESSFADWKKIIMEWKSMPGYRVALYLPYEHVMASPDLVHDVAFLLQQQVGWPTAPEKDWTCLWSKAIAPERRRIANFYQYQPLYTKRQSTWMIQQMQAFQTEVHDDSALVHLLGEYVEEIRGLKADDDG